MTVLKKINPKLRKPLAKELMQYGIINEVRRYIGKGKKVVPRIIPFVNDNQLDIAAALKLQGIDPGTYSSPATEFDTPAGIVAHAGKVLRIPLLTPQNSLYYMHSVRYWAQLINPSPVKYPPVSQNATIKALSSFYDKWKKTTSPIQPFTTQIETNGTSATPDATVNASPGSFDGKTIHPGMTFILPLYEDDEGDPSGADPIGYKQLQVADPNYGATPDVLDSFELTEMDGTPYPIKFQGSTPVFWPVQHGNMDTITPFYHYLKVALIANSPKKTIIYGGLNDVPALTDENGLIDNKLSSPHVERMYADTLQGQNNGYNQIERKHLFGLDNSIVIEIENIKSYDMLVNGYVFGYQIQSRGKPA